MSKLRLYLFGNPRVELNDQPVDIPRRKVTAILIYLAVTRQKQRRDALAALLWPETGQQNARTSLRRELYAINSAIGDEWLVTSREEVSLNPNADVWLDVEEFRYLLATCNEHGHPVGDLCDECLELMTSATQLYQNDFLAGFTLSGFTLSGTSEFDEWQLFEAETLRRDYVDALDTLAQLHESRYDYDTAIGFARRRLALDTRHEPAHCMLMRLFALAGKQTAAARQYDECVRILNEELGIPPQEETSQLYEAIRTRRFPAKPAPTSDVGLAEKSASRPPTTSLPQPIPKHNLPPQPTPFIGRKHELAEVRQILREETSCRLLTVLGSGGIGKTRLSIEAATGLMDTFPDGVYFVGLASVSTVENMISAIVESLNIPLQGTGDPKAQLTNYLHSKKLLLVIDNLEHLLDGAAILAELLASTIDIKILTTSREALGLQAEWLYPLDGLRFPVDNVMQGEARPDRGLAFDAIDLFVQRAKQTGRDFSLQEEYQEYDDVVRICRLVDGMPLALELAATWLLSLPIPEIANELERGMDILTAQHRNVPERHRSMRVVLEQSWRYLNIREQESLARLSIFRGGFQRDAAKEAAGTSLPTLASLLDKSFLRRNDERYHLHELTRQFVAEKLDERGEIDRVQELHASYYLSLLIAQSDALRGADPAAIFRPLRAELDNLRQAWRYAASAGLVDVLYECFETVAYFYEFAGLLSEGQLVFVDAANELQRNASLADSEHHTNLVCHFFIKGVYFSRYLDQPQAVEPLDARIRSILPQCTDPLCRANYLSAVGLCDFLAGRPKKAVPSFQEALPLYRDGGTHYQLAAHLHVMGEVLARIGKLDKAETFMQEALELSVNHGDMRGRAITISHMGVLAFMREDFWQAHEHFSTAVSLFKEIGDLWRAERTENNDGFTLLQLEQYEDALGAIRRALSRQDLYDASSEKSYIYDSLGQIYYAMGDLQNARDYHKKSLVEADAHDMQHYVIEALVGLAKIDIAEESFNEALARLEQATASLDDVPSPLQYAKVYEAGGDLHAATTNHQDALQRYDQAIAHYLEAGNRHDRCHALLSKGSLLLRLDRKDEAHKALEESLDLAKQVGRRSVIERAERLLQGVE